MIGQLACRLQSATGSCHSQSDTSEEACRLRIPKRQSEGRVYFLPLLEHCHATLLSVIHTELPALYTREPNLKLDKRSNSQTHLGRYIVRSSISPPPLSPPAIAMLHLTPTVSPRFGAQCYNCVNWRCKTANPGMRKRKQSRMQSDQELA